MAAPVRVRVPDNWCLDPGVLDTLSVGRHDFALACAAAYFPSMLDAASIGKILGVAPRVVKVSFFFASILGKTEWLEQIRTDAFDTATAALIEKIRMHQILQPRLEAKVLGAQAALTELLKTPPNPIDPKAVKRHKQAVGGHEKTISAPKRNRDTLAGLETERGGLQSKIFFPSPIPPHPIDLKIAAYFHEHQEAIIAKITAKPDPSGRKRGVKCEQKVGEHLKRVYKGENVTLYPGCTLAPDRRIKCKAEIDWVVVDNDIGDVICAVEVKAGPGSLVGDSRKMRALIEALCDGAKIKNKAGDIFHVAYKFTVEVYTELGDYAFGPGRLSKPADVTELLTGSGVAITKSVVVTEMADAIAMGKAVDFATEDDGARIRLSVLAPVAGKYRDIILHDIREAAQAMRYYYL